MPGIPRCWFYSCVPPALAVYTISGMHLKLILQAALLLSKKDSACLVIHAGFGTVSIISWFRELLGFKWILPPWEMAAVFHHIFSYHPQIISSA